MNRVAIALIATCIGYCYGSFSMAEDDLKAVREALDALQTRKSSVPENVETIPELRALIPPTAQYRPYPALGIHNSWVVSDSLADAMSWYRQAMAERGFKPKLRTCKDESIWGGRALIVDYCSATHYLELKLGEDTSNKFTTIQLQYSDRPPSFDCTALVFPEKWTETCPIELLP
jgi:hypothetical protein